MLLHALVALFQMDKIYVDCVHLLALNARIYQLYAQDVEVSFPICLNLITLVFLNVPLEPIQMQTILARHASHPVRHAPSLLHHAHPVCQREQRYTYLFQSA